LHRLVALRDLGLSLQQIGEVLPEDPTVEQLRGMLRLRRAELEQQLIEDEARLRRVEAHLRALEGDAVVSNLDVVMKTSEPIRVVEVQGRAAGFGHENLEPVFERLVPQVLGAVGERGTKPGMMVAWYDEPEDDGSVVVHVGFDIGDQDYDPDEPTSLAVLPRVRVASVVHKGPMDDIGLVYEALVGWIEASGERLTGRSRELYLQQDDEHPDRSVTELQMPVAG
jgi:effector-binding domain-containing protein